MMSTMRIALTVTLDLDPAVWAAEYGTGATRHAVRDDVLAHVRTNIRSHYVDHLGLIDDTRVDFANPPRS
jgi:hypothetical protein